MEEYNAGISPAGIGGAMNTVFGTFASMGLNAYNNRIAEEREDRARAKNFAYSEQAARLADARTRSLYSDLYSPKARLQQLREAGLSPSLMYGDSAGVQGASSQISNGTGGVMPNVFGVDPMAGAQYALAMAQTQNLEADTAKKREETQNIHKRTELLDIEKSFKKCDFDLYHIDYQLMTEYVDVNGERKSLYEFAQSCTSYDDFVKQLREMGIAHQLVNTEQGQNTLREIFLSSSVMERDIAVLTEETISSNFQRSLVNCLSKKDFAELNAEAAVQQLRSEIEVNELTESQKAAWNNLLDKLGKKGSTTRDIAIIAGLLISQALQHVSIRRNKVQGVFNHNYTYVKK